MIRRARQADLVEYLRGQGIDLLRDGSRHRHPEHDSLIFKGNAYYWNSRQESGNSIDYLVRHMGKTFPEAIRDLTRGSSGATEVSNPLVVPAITKDMRRAIAYLTKTRGVSSRLVQELIRRKLILQTAERNNILFPWYNQEGQIVGGELCGTLTHHRYKGILPGSVYGKGYAIQYGQPNKAFFFESAIDMLSYIDILHIKKKAAYIQDSIFVSMAGLKAEVVYSHQEAAGRVYICVDSDQAGDKFWEGLQGKIEGIQRHSPPGCKDWNEYLQRS